ncbi:MAG: L-threonylcarbamoyladenylate synthase [Patescibacteria group bacterium]
MTIRTTRAAAIKILKHGGVGVMPTDTIYGLVGQALNPEAVTQIYKLKQRPTSKPFIILISDLSDLKKFKVNPSSTDRRIIRQVWPGPISIIFSRTLACRLPALPSLRKFLKQTGPLIATSANIAGGAPAHTITMAKKYFGPVGKGVDFYLAGKIINRKPSTLVKIKRGKIIVVRT